MKLKFIVRIPAPETHEIHGYIKYTGDCSESCPYLDIVDHSDMNAFCHFLQVGLEFYGFYTSECTLTYEISDHKKIKFKKL